MTTNKCHQDCANCTICKDQEKFDEDAQKATEQENLKLEDQELSRVGS